MVYNLYKPILDASEILSKAIIKVVTNKLDELVYMSRESIPFSKSGKEALFSKQVCVYGFTKKALEIFSASAKTQNEVVEDIEILRFVDLGHKVKMIETKFDSISVDIPEDVKKVELFLNKT